MVAVVGGLWCFSLRGGTRASAPLTPPSTPQLLASVADTRNPGPGKSHVIMSSRPYSSYIPLENINSLSFQVGVVLF